MCYIINRSTRLKAFDTLDHDILLKNLYIYGIIIYSIEELQLTFLKVIYLI